MQENRSSPETRPRATSGCCSSTASRSWTRSAPGRSWRTGRCSTPRTAGPSRACPPTARDVTGAKGLVLGAHHSFADAPALDVLIHPGGIGTRRLMRDAGAPATGCRAQRATRPLMASVCTGSLVYAAAGLLSGQAGHHALGLAEPALRARPHRRDRRRRAVRRRRGPHHQRRGQRRHRHGAAPRGPAGRGRARPRGTARHPVRPPAAGVTPHEIRTGCREPVSGSVPVAKATRMGRTSTEERHDGQVPAAQALPRRPGGGQRRTDGEVDARGGLGPHPVHARLRGPTRGDRRVRRRSGARARRDVRPVRRRRAARRSPTVPSPRPKTSSPAGW